MMLNTRTQHTLYQIPRYACVQATSRQLAGKTSTSTTGQTCRAAGTALALVIGFLPWKGCSQGGFYDTGVGGAHGEHCQAIYQPAAAAEARFAESLRNRNSSGNSNTPDRLQPLGAATVAAASPAPELVAVDADSSSSASSSLSSSGSASSCTAEPNVQCTVIVADVQTDMRDASIAEQMQQVPDAAKDLVRNILRDDNQKRTKHLVDDAWQTLE